MSINATSLSKSPETGAKKDFDVVIFEDMQGKMHTLIGTIDEVEKKAVENGWMEEGCKRTVKPVIFEDLTKDGDNGQKNSGWMFTNDNNQDYLVYGTLEDAKKKAATYGCMVE